MTPGISALSEHHRRLDDRFGAIVARAQGGDRDALREEWLVFERDLLDHLAREEAEVLPAFERFRPDEVAKVRAEHESIRVSLLKMGVDLDLHLLRADVVEAFVTELRDHARREQELLYPWAASQLDSTVRTRLFEVI
jgi:hypothetical protein